VRGLKTYAMGAKNIAAAVWVRGGSGKTVIYPPLGWEWPLKRSFPEAHRGGMEGADNVVESRGQDIESLEVVPRELNSVFQLKLKSKNWVIISVGTYISSSK
jgi:hypothetical protein